MSTQHIFLGTGGGGGGLENGLEVTSGSTTFYILSLIHI